MTENPVHTPAGVGGCKKCGCKAWKSDSGKPEKCVNSNSAGGACGHAKEDHS